MKITTEKMSRSILAFISLSASLRTPHPPTGLSQPGRDAMVANAPGYMHVCQSEGSEGRDCQMQRADMQTPKIRRIGNKFAPLLALGI